MNNIDLDDDLKVNSARLLTKLMDRANVNTYELARRTGMHPNTIYNWTKYHRQPSYFNLITCVQALGYDIEFTSDEDPEPPQPPTDHWVEDTLF